MGERTAIEWTDHTFNPWYGCTKISPGCENCYAEGWAKRSGLVEWDGPPRRASESAWSQPRKWNKEAARTGTRKRVFCASLADVFDNQAPVEWRNDLWGLIASTPHLDWLLLTKRPQNIAGMLPHVHSAYFNPWPWSHVWLGTTAANQEEFDRRWPHLAAVPVARRFLSVEPMLGQMRLVSRLSPKDGGVIRDAAGGQVDYVDPEPGIDWVICGGESGPGARPMHPDWARDLRDQCAAASVPFFFKQWGEWLSADQPGAGEILVRERRYLDVTGHECHGSKANAVMHRVGKKASAALLDGRAHREMPA